MISSRFAIRIALACRRILPLLVIVACQPQPMQTSRKKPAEAPLPAKGSANALREVDKLLAKYEWGEAHDAPCAGCAPGDVSIRVIGLTKDLKGSKGPDHRRIVALIQNFSDQDVVHSLYKRTFKANTRYLMFVDVRKPDNKATWGFISLDSEYDPEIAPIGLFENCKVHRPASQIDDANFQECGDPYPPQASSSWIKSAFAAAAAAGGTISKPGWVSCDPDCCTGTTNPVVAQQ